MYWWDLFSNLAPYRSKMSSSISFRSRYMKQAEPEQKSAAEIVKED
jgi:hypothetical protein